MPMTNADLQAAVSKFGKKLAVIICDNGMHAGLDYKNRTITLENIQYDKFGETEVFGCTHTEYGGWGGTIPFEVTEWHLTECIQSLSTVSDERFRPEIIRYK